MFFDPYTRKWTDHHCCNFVIPIQGVDLIHLQAKYFLELIMDGKFLNASRMLNKLLKNDPYIQPRVKHAL